MLVGRKRRRWIGCKWIWGNCAGSAWLKRRNHRIGKGRKVHFCRPSMLKTRLYEWRGLSWVYRKCGLNRPISKYRIYWHLRHLRHLRYWRHMRHLRYWRHMRHLRYWRHLRHWSISIAREIRTRRNERNRNSQWGTLLLLLLLTLLQPLLLKPNATLPLLLRKHIFQKRTLRFWNVDYFRKSSVAYST